MFKCEFCEEMVDELFDCMNCGAMVCADCFNHYEELCVECAPDDWEEDEEDDEDWLNTTVEDWMQDVDEDWDEDDFDPCDDEIPW